MASTEIVDILAACDFDRPDISGLSDEFMLGLPNMQHRNLAVEALKKLLNGEISARIRTNVVQKEMFSSRLHEAIRFGRAYRIPASGSRRHHLAVELSAVAGDDATGDGACSMRFFIFSAGWSRSPGRGRPHQTGRTAPPQSALP